MTPTSEAAPVPAPVKRPLWRRLIGFNLLSAVVLAAVGYYLGARLGHTIDNGKSFAYEEASDENDIALLFAYIFGVIGFLIGLGFANYPVSRLLGRPASLMAWGRSPGRRPRALAMLALASSYFSQEISTKPMLV